MIEPTALMRMVFQRAEQMGLDRKLARLSGLEDSRLEKIRQGDPVSSTEFERLCRALAVDSGAMFCGRASSPTRSPARFRAATAVENPSPDDVRLLALAAEQGRIIGGLMGLLGKEVRLRRHRRVTGIQGGGDELWKEGYGLGEAARSALAPGCGPLSNLPRLMNEAGIHVALIPMSSEHIDAASIWEPEAAPVVLVNSKSHVFDHPGALHACLAHEMCHLLHDAGERDLTTNVSWGPDGPGNYQDALEVRARAFAPAFLAPRACVRAWHDSTPERLKNDAQELIKSLAETWGFSFEGAAWHAKNCGIIEPAEADRLANLPRKPAISLEAFKHNEEPCCPNMFHAELPEEAAPLWQGWACILALGALEEGLISVGRARELLTWR